MIPYWVALVGVCVAPYGHGSVLPAQGVDASTKISVALCLDPESGHSTELNPGGIPLKTFFIYATVFFISSISFLFFLRTSIIYYLPVLEFYLCFPLDSLTY